MANYHVTTQGGNVVMSRWSGDTHRILSLEMSFAFDAAGYEAISAVFGELLPILNNKDFKRIEYEYDAKMEALAEQAEAS